ncbi:hypothetical protein HA402_005238 [Bradysia odoriphaga]|nr:hypothetical protein HA402_005238 [Bradysia odoriphaga]
MADGEREQAITELLAVIDDNGVNKILNLPKIEYYERERRRRYQSLPVEQIKLMTQRLQSLKKRTPQQELQHQSVLSIMAETQKLNTEHREQQRLNDLSEKTPFEK